MQTIMNVLSPKYEYTKGRDAWHNNLRLTVFAAERVRSSLGPNGAYKMVSYNRGPEKIVKVTKDAAAVLKELAIQYPTVAILAEAAKIQRQEVGDGVTSFVVLSSALLKKADELIAKGVHPTTILNGYLEAAKKALEIISANSKKNPALERVLETVDCGRGLLTKEIRRSIIEAAAIANKDGKMDKDKIRIIRKPGESTSETKLIKGIAIKKNKLHPNMPDSLAKPRIAITSERIGSNRLEIKMPSEGPLHMKFDVNTPQKLAACKEAEKNLKTEALKQLDALGVNVLFSQQPIDNCSKSKLLAMNVLAFETVDQKDLAIISKATGAAVGSNLAELSESDLGNAANLEIENLGLEKMVTLNCKDYATFLLRGYTMQAIDELELVIRNSLTLLQTANQGGGFVAGGGATEFHVARQLRSFSRQFSGREQLAVECFAEALMEIPRCLAENNGLNSMDVSAQMSKAHAEGSSSYGVGADGCCNDVCAELSEVKTAVIRRAYDVASLMLRIDEQITSKEVLKFHKQ
jgi:chaperonin GroEL (HSP60 family)